MQRGQELLLKNYVVPKREVFFGANSRRLPAAQNPDIRFSISEQGEVTVTNNDSVSIDISGVPLSRLKVQVPAGTVLLPGQSGVFSLERKPAPPLIPGQLHISVMARE
jgi:hypothetical protein